MGVICFLYEYCISRMKFYFGGGVQCTPLPDLSSMQRPGYGALGLPVLDLHLDLVVR